uniref:DUF7748 domain-containing protein n=1 Tax=Physcomitrium patens TaxID=3218 RepID=A0A2K1IEM8_PHYPA|nr:hypothetical protein PHYPA_029884 [Physcomitrium patens]
MSNILSTEISNETNHKLMVRVRCGRDASDVGTIEASKKIQIRVDRNATYHEYTVGVEAALGQQSLVMFVHEFETQLG